MRSTTADIEQVMVKVVVSFMVDRNIKEHMYTRGIADVRKFLKTFR